MMYVAQVIGLLLIALGLFKEASIVCEFFNLSHLSGDQNSCSSGIWSAPIFLVVAGVTTILFSLTLLLVKNQILKTTWLVGFVFLLFFYLSDGLRTCGDFLCGIASIYSIAFYTISLFIWTIFILGLYFLIKFLRTRKIKPTLK